MTIYNNLQQFTTIYNNLQQFTTIYNKTVFVIFVSWTFIKL